MARLTLKILNSAMAIDPLRGSQRHDFDDTTDDSPSTGDGIDSASVAESALMNQGAADAAAHRPDSRPAGGHLRRAVLGRTRGHQLTGPTPEVPQQLCACPPPHNRPRLPGPITAPTASHAMAHAPPLTRPTSRARRQLRRAGTGLCSVYSKGTASGQCSVCSTTHNLRSSSCVSTCSRSRMTCAAQVDRRRVVPDSAAGLARAEQPLIRQNRARSGMSARCARPDWGFRDRPDACPAGKF